MSEAIRRHTVDRGPSHQQLRSSAIVCVTGTLGNVGVGPKHVEPGTRAGKKLAAVEGERKDSSGRRDYSHRNHILVRIEISWLRDPEQIVVFQIAEIGRAIRADCEARWLVSSETLIPRQLAGTVKRKHGRVWIWQRAEN